MGSRSHRPSSSRSESRERSRHRRRDRSHDRHHHRHYDDSRSRSRERSRRRDRSESSRRSHRHDRSRSRREARSPSLSPERKPHESTQSEPKKVESVKPLPSSFSATDSSQYLLSVKPTSTVTRSLRFDEKGRELNEFGEVVEAQIIKPEYTLAINRKQQPKSQINPCWLPRWADS